MDSLLYGIVIVLFSFLMFFLLRSVMLWYWKIETIVRNQEEQKRLMREQNRFLEQIYLLQGGYKMEYSNDSPEEAARKARLFDEWQR